MARRKLHVMGHVHSKHAHTTDKGEFQKTDLIEESIWSKAFDLCEKRTANGSPSFTARIATFDAITEQWMNSTPLIITFNVNRNPRHPVLQVTKYDSIGQELEGSECDITLSSTPSPVEIALELSGAVFDLIRKETKLYAKENNLVYDVDVTDDFLNYPVILDRWIDKCIEVSYPKIRKGTRLAKEMLMFEEFKQRCDEFLAYIRGGCE